MENLLGIYKAYADFTATNQFLGAAVAAGVVGGCAWIFRSLPQKIWRLILARTTATTVLHSDSNWRNRENFEKFCCWAKDRVNSYDNSVRITFDSEDRIVPSFGYGRHWFRYDGCLYWISLTVSENSSTSGNIKETIQIRCLSLSRKPMLKLMANVFAQPTDKKSSIFNYQNGFWQRNFVPPRTLMGVVTTDNLGEQILANIRKFISERSWYERTGVAYKLCIMLHGEPGTGKTSLIRALGTELNRFVYTLNLGQVTDDEFVEAIRKMKPGSILSLEDVDCVGSTLTRKKTEPGGSPVENKEENIKSVSLSGVLNTLDGLIPLDDVIVIMTTNHLGKIDPAMLRRGRTDYTHEIVALNEPAVNRLSQFLYGRPVKFSGRIKGCDLQHIAIENKANFDGFSSALTLHK